MHIQIETSQIEKLAVDAAAVICFEAAEKTSEEAMAVAPLQSADPEIADQGGWLAELRASGEFTGKLYETSILHRPQGLQARRLLVVGGGKREKFTAIEARRIAASLVRALKGKGVKTIGLLMPDDNVADLAEAVEFRGKVCRPVRPAR